MSLSFYKPSNQRKLRKFFRKHDFTLEEGGEHSIARHNKTGEVFSFPRHNNISNGLTKKICDRLLALGYDEEEIRRTILK